MFVSLFVCVLQDNGRKYYPIRLKIGINGDIKCKISPKLVSGAHRRNNTHWGIPKSILIHYYGGKFIKFTFGVIIYKFIGKKL